MQQLIQLRWIAVVGQVTTIATATMFLGVDLPLPAMLRVLACLVAFNIFSHLRWHEQRTVDNRQLFLALLVDVFSLTAQLYLSGGMTNPFVFLYLLQVILAAVLLQPWSSWTIVAITGMCVAALALFAPPLALPADGGPGTLSLYMKGILISFLVNAALLVIFITRITRNVRTGDAALADLRQRAAEEEHIVRMGLLASGAAHELGTPLATLAVILGDWKRMPEFAKNPELLAEIAEMQTQIKRCKAIVSGILLSGGQARGESSAKTTMKVFLDQLVDEWRASRPIVSFEYDNRIERDIAVVSDSALKQMICNVLDNALEASPQWLRLEASRDRDSLNLVVTDAGPGFAPGMLDHVGKPYQSTKGRPGGGLGLFLVVNVARTLGGSVAARNREHGGALVRLSLPLSAIALDPEESSHAA
ncbi:ATP-binding protein [Massilia sp. R2A-15]|uniref:ATP-binding protein n=1 Tax=Massilia sp. R2A-15 TaxID=3064278 RepID=UPI002734F9D6|nr:ATP-binding protein [Massilia sp. R2A-15]WLI91788.1 ATP-binding protein [Massilia sp. R2A-15]